MSGINTAVNRLLNDFGLRDFQLERIRAGRNSRVWRVDSYAGVSYIIKEYFRHPSDPRDRLSTEYEFLAFLQSQGLSNVPIPLAKDPGGNVGLYSYLPGNPVTKIDSNYIQQAAQFILDINQDIPVELAPLLPSASEACFSIADHLCCVRQRIERLQLALESNSNSLTISVREFVNNTLCNAYEEIVHHIESRISAKDIEKTLDPSQRILSPSDYGFHNILEFKGQLFFLDFEYAGWDDPTKLLCDFASQPQYPVSREHLREFADHLHVLPTVSQLWVRSQPLLPLHRLKWCCILLNEFRVQDRQRRHHAGDDQSDKLTIQWHKAQTYFQENMLKQMRDGSWL
ncbi:MAG: phosphotransferase [Cyanobacteria bacterium REEB494]|uniref:phosphotransferase n=1 Tax=Cylindrospermopsis raciborskii TaxID=77022 RepID=UPI003EB77DB1|nr:phosphotransferase [Cyanobacteria bacterium REEB494]